jgi:hypothetical protein
MMMIGSTISAIVVRWPAALAVDRAGAGDGLEQLHEDGEPQDPVHDGRHTGEVTDVRVDESGEFCIAGVLPM